MRKKNWPSWVADKPPWYTEEQWEKMVEEEIESEKKKLMEWARARHYPVIRGDSRIPLSKHVVVITRQSGDHFSIWRYMGGRLITVSIRTKYGDWGTFYTN